MASVTGNNKTVNVFARDLQAVELDPPKVTFSVTPSGLRKISEHLRTGRPQQLDSEEVFQAKSTFDFLLPKGGITGWKLHLLPQQGISSRSLALRLTFAKNDEIIQYEYVQFRVARGGTEEIEIESTSPLPLVLSLILALAKGAGSSLSWKTRLEGADVRQAAKAIQALSLLKNGGSLELYALDGAQQIGTLSLGLAHPERRTSLEDVVVAAAAVCDKYSINLRVPRHIRQRDHSAVNLLLAIADGAPMGASNFSAKLVKSVENEGNVKFVVAQSLEISASAEQFEPKPVIFGVPVDTGPVTLYATGARIKRPKVFMRRYASANYGDALPIEFDVRDFQVVRKAGDQKLLIRVEDRQQRPQVAGFLPKPETW